MQYHNLSNNISHSIIDEEEIQVNVHGKVIVLKKRNGKFVKPLELTQLSGMGSAIKPSWEPVLMFRKPLSEPTIATNVLLHGTGAINIDASRIGSDATLPEIEWCDCEGDDGS